MRKWVGWECVLITLTLTSMNWQPMVGWNMWKREMLVNQCIEAKMSKDVGRRSQQMAFCPCPVPTTCPPPVCLKQTLETSLVTKLNKHNLLFVISKRVLHRVSDENGPSAQSNPIIIASLFMTADVYLFIYSPSLSLFIHHFACIISICLLTQWNNLRNTNIK